jgi:hypothetical protein
MVPDYPLIKIDMETFDHAMSSPWLLPAIFALVGAQRTEAFHDVAHGHQHHHYRC